MEEKRTYNLSIQETFKKYETRENGLNKEELNARIQAYGKNVLKEGKKDGIIKRFLEQFKDLMVIVLVIASIVSGIIDISHGDGLTNTAIILSIVLANAIIGVIQELRAEKSLEALKKLTTHKAKVIREGEKIEIDASDLVPGDIVIVEDGDYVPADIRIIEAVNLKVEEAGLTGESVPVEKNIEILDGEKMLGDRTNMIFSSSLVTYGRGMGIVTSTGMETEVGKIAQMLTEVEDKQTPLKRKLNALGRTLAILAGIICIAIFVIGVNTGKSILSMLITSISLAVAAIPEGLPAIATIVQAMGVKKLAGKNAIVKKMPSVETLGSATVICSDKTGTLTQNKMTVVEEYLTDDKKREHFLNTMVLCNNGKLNQEKGGKDIGDPTETALLRYVYNEDKDKYMKIQKIKRVFEIPFDSAKKYMVTVNAVGDEYYAYKKGGLDEVYQSSIKDEKMYTKIEAQNQEMGEKALRVLSFSHAKLMPTFAKMTDREKEKYLENIEYEMLGIVGMIDPPRKEAKEAIKVCKNAGIIPIMITGDHKVTAAAIAKELGILTEDKRVVEGAVLEKMSDQMLEEIVEKVAVFARVSPEHKVKIVKALQRKGHVVAMTGDGVNDAPALKNAEIGCAMGITGTDVSKEAADLIITDDNFATIVGAVEEGRRIYDNIIKSIQYLLSSNIGEIIVILLTILFAGVIAEKTGVGHAVFLVPLLPIHILWINLVTDSLPALALAEDEGAKKIMERKPNTSKTIFNKKVIFSITYQGILIGILTFIAFIVGLYTDGDWEKKIMTGQTMAFLMLGFGELAHVFNVRSNTESMFYKGMLKNKLLILAVFINSILMLGVMFIEPIRNMFKLTLLDMNHIAILAVLVITPNIVSEFVKMIIRKSEKG